MYFWENTLFRGRTNSKPMDTFLWLRFLRIISFFMSSLLRFYRLNNCEKKCLSWRLKRVWCNEKSTLFLWRQELCHLPIILYPLQYIKQKSRNVVQEITIIKTCQQSKLHCKTINNGIRARKFKYFSNWKTKDPKVRDIQFRQICDAH